MTLTLDPSPHQLDVLRREADRRGTSVEAVLNDAIKDVILEIEYADCEPNQETINAIEEARRGEGERFESVEDLCRDLDIPCER